MLRKFKLSFKEADYTVRVLTRREAMKLNKDYPDTIPFQTAVCETCVIDCEVDNLIAGRVKTLAEFILTKSGYVSENNVLALDADKWLKSNEGKLETLVLTFLHGYSLDYLWDCDSQEWFHLVKAAQDVAEKIYGVNLFAYFNPEKAKAERDRQALQNRVATPKGRHLQSENSGSWHG